MHPKIKEQKEQVLKEEKTNYKQAKWRWEPQYRYNYRYQARQ